MFEKDIIQIRALGKATRHPQKHIALNIFSSLPIRRKIIYVLVKKDEENNEELKFIQTLILTLF